MIHTHITYVRPDSLEEAMQAWTSYTNENANGVHYLAGGTEITTGTRDHKYAPRVLIDIKALEEMNLFETKDGKLLVGAALSLNAIRDSRKFPLLSATLRGIADRTTRNRLSLGGNLAGRLPYREAALPLLLADAVVNTISPVGLERRSRPFRALCGKRLELQDGELLLNFTIAPECLQSKWKHYRATSSATVDYPVLTACFMRKPSLHGEHSIQVAFSGLNPYPVFYESTESAREALHQIKSIHTDQRASAEYRQALALDMIAQAEKELR